MQCVQCGHGRQYVPEYQQWWCGACQTYVPGPAPGTPMPPPRAGGAATAAAPGRGDTLGILLLLVPFVGLAMLWFWVGESMLIQAESNLALTGLVVVVASAVLAGVDASQIGMTRQHGGGPGTVVVGVVILWLVAYPWYMARRTRVAPHAGRYGVGAFVGAAAFTASYVYIAVLVADRLSALGV